MMCHRGLSSTARPHRTFGQEHCAQRAIVPRRVIQVPARPRPYPGRGWVRGTRLVRRHGARSSGQVSRMVCGGAPCHESRRGLVEPAAYAEEVAQGWIFKKMTQQNGLGRLVASRPGCSEGRLLKRDRFQVVDFHSIRETRSTLWPGGEGARAGFFRVADGRPAPSGRRPPRN